MNTISVAEETTASDRGSRTLRLADGRQLGYGEFGDPRGLPVLALHGTPGSRFMFALTDREARDRGLRIIAPERPGYGLSGFRHCRTLAETAEDVKAVADALGLERFGLIGVSGGGPHAVAAAAAMPERVSLLALIGPVGPIAECSRHIRMTTLHRLVFTRMSRSRGACALFFWTLRTLARHVPGVAFRLLLQRVTPSDRAVLLRPEVKANLQAAIREGLRPGIGGALQDLRLFCGVWNLPLAEIDVPAALWQGGDDTIVPPDAACHLACELPNCRLDVIQGVGHYWVFGQFGRMLDAVEAGLRA
ncbi:MAG: alpha/beta fold hydrolase [Methyloceanibacter sp.]